MGDLKVYLEANENNNYIGTLAIGEQYLNGWETNSLPYWIEYCKKHKIGLVAQVNPIEDEGKKRVDWQKIAMPYVVKSNINKAKLFCFVDYDIIPSPGARNIFDETEKGKIGIVSQRKWLPYGNVETILKRIAFFRHMYCSNRYPLDSYITRKTEEIFRDHGLTEFDNYACGGLFTLDLDMWSAEMMGWFKKYSSDSCLVANPGEEVYLNFHIQNTNQVQWLDYKWQTLWWYEMGYMHFELYKKENRDERKILAAIENSLSRCDFMHFVGSWEKWAWDYVKHLDYKKMTIYKDLKDYMNADLKSPNLGLCLPDDRKNISL